MLFFITPDRDYAGRVYKECVGVNIFNTALEVIEHRVECIETSASEAMISLIEKQKHLEETLKWSNVEKLKLLKSNKD